MVPLKILKTCGVMRLPERLPDLVIRQAVNRPAISRLLVTQEAHRRGPVLCVHLASLVLETFRELVLEGLQLDESNHRVCVAYMYHRPNERAHLCSE